LQEVINILTLVIGKVFPLGSLPGGPSDCPVNSGWVSAKLLGDAGEIFFVNRVDLRRCFRGGRKDNGRRNWRQDLRRRLNNRRGFYGGNLFGNRLNGSDGFDRSDRFNRHLFYRGNRRRYGRCWRRCDGSLGLHRRSFWSGLYGHLRGCCWCGDGSLSHDAVINRHFIGIRNCGFRLRRALCCALLGDDLKRLAKLFILLLAGSGWSRASAQRATNNTTHCTASSNRGDGCFTVFPVCFRGLKV
jgi:hypothetical protein